MAENPLGRLMEMPRNPARAPGPLEQLISDATVNPLWEIAQGVGAAASGYGNSPEAGAGLMAGIGIMSPMQRMIKPIRAYHVSPHDFDKFDMSKIGTGQGAQSYGHGLYMAENPKVSGGQNSEYWREFSERFIGKQNPEGLATKYLADNAGDRAKATAQLQSELEYYKPGGPLTYPGINVGGHFPAFKDANKALELLKSDKIVGPRTYEVDIHAKPEQFLDWDKPLAGQSPVVQETYRAIRGERGGMPSDVRTGGQIYDLIGDAFTKSGHGMKQAYRENATNTLAEAGIPGIKYLDQGSRQVSGGELIDVFKGPDGWQSKIRMNRPNGEQYFTTSMPFKSQDEANSWAQSKIGQTPTSNYVLFNDSIIEIMKKYGLTGAVAGPLGALLAGGNNQAQAGQ